MDKPQEQTDAQTTETEPKETSAETPAAQAPADDDKAGLRAALAKQAVEKDAEKAALQKKLNAYEAKDLATKEAKMIEDGKQSDLITDLRKQIADKDAVMVMDKRALLVASAGSKLRDLGMTHAKIIRGTLADLPEDATAETLDAWAAEMKGKNPGDFTAPATPVGQASLPGGPAVNGSDTASLEARLQSDDPKVKAAAYSEQLRNELSGKS